MSVSENNLTHISEGGIYKSFFENHPDAAYILDLEGSCLDANPACHKVFGYSRSEFLNMSFTQIVAPEKLHEWCSGIVEQWHKGKFLTFETTILHKDGHRIDLQITDTPIVIDGEIVGVFGTAKNVTEQKRTSLLLDSVFRHAKDAMIVTDYKGTIVAWNQGAATLFGYTAEERIGSTLSLIIPGRFREAHQRGLERYLAAHEKRIIDQTVELVGVRKDGQEIPIELSISTFGTEEQTYFIGIIRDITERKESERVLRQSRERYESLKKYNPNGICSFDLKGSIIGANPSFERITGYSLEEVRNVNLTEILLYEEDIKWAQTTFVPGSTVKGIETKIKHKSGRRIYVRVTNVPIVIDDKLFGYYVILEDITDQKHNQEALLESQRLFKLVSDNSTDIISSWTGDGICDYISPSVVRLLGYQQVEVIGKPATDLFHYDDIDYIGSIAHRITQGEDIDRFTCRARSKNGNYKWYETTLKILRDDLGNVVQTVGVSRDISEQMSLQESLENAVRIARLGHWDLDIEKGSLSFSNQMYWNLGMEPSTEPVTYAQFLSLVHPEDVEWVERSMNRSIQTGSPFDRIYRIVRKDGAIRYFHRQGEVLLDEAGKPVRMFGTSQDITEQNMLEQELYQSEERYRRLVENSMDAIGVIQDGKWVFMNSVGLKMFGASNVEEIVGRDYLDFLDPNHHEESQNRMRSILSQHTVQPVEFKWRRKNGEVFYAEGLGSKFGNNAIQVCIRDITERKKTDELIRQSEKLSAVGQLAAGIAHEIRNPLTSLKGFTQILRKKSRQPNRRYYDIMMAELERIDSILREMLFLAKPQEERFKHHDVELILNEVVSLLGTQAVIKNISVETDFAEDIPLVRCDQSQIKQVFLNVIKNAIEAMPSGGTITAKIGTDVDKIYIDVTDEGEGIPEDRIPKLGEPFFTTKEQGTGLGLMMSHKIISAHNGTMDISSTLGKGTTVRIALPVLTR